MRQVTRGDIVRVEGYPKEQQGTVLALKEDKKVTVQIGTAVIMTRAENILVLSRNNKDDGGHLIEPKLEIGDKVKWIWLNPNPEYPNAWGEVVGFVSEKRALVKWVGKDEPRVERISRLKWIPFYPIYINA